MEQGRPILSSRHGAAFLAPAAAFVLIFLVLPFFGVILLSFTNATLMSGLGPAVSFVGLENFRGLFPAPNWMDPGEFGNALRISFIFVIGSALVGQATLGLAIAVLFDRRPGRLREVLSTMVILAWIIPDVV